MGFNRGLRLRCCGWLAVAAVCIWNIAPANAQSAGDSSPLATSVLSIAPRDASFVGTSLNMREAWDEFLSGSFVTELRQIPYVQRLEGAIKEKLLSDDPNIAKFMALVRSPNGKNLLNILRDMMSQEMFVIGGKEWCDFVVGFAEVQAQINEVAAGGEEAMKEFFAELDKETVDKLVIPTTIMGWRLTNDTNVRVFLDVLEATARFGLASIEAAKPFLDELKRADLANGQLLSWTVRAKMIPWDQLPLDELSEEQQAIIDRLTELLEDRQITLSLGTVNNRLMIALSEQANVLQELGKGETLLGHPRMQQLVKEPPKKLRSINFMSAAWREASYQLNFGNYFGNLATQIGNVAKTSIDSDEAFEFIDQIAEDAHWIDEQLAEMIDSFEDSLMYSYATEKGLEGYAWDWTKNPLLANAKPLSILNNAGSQPLVLVGSKMQWPKPLAKICDTVLDKLPEYVEQLGKLELVDDAKLEIVSDKILPLVIEGYEIVRDKICRSMDKHENVLSIAAQLTTDSLGEDSPPIETPLPIPEIGVASRLSNKDLFLSGCQDMHAWFNKVVDLVRELDPNSVPESYSIPLPQEESIAGGTRYYYDLPDGSVPFDGIQMQVLVTESTAAFGYSTRQITDMAQDKPLLTRPAWLTKDSEVATVAYVDLAGIFAAARPWIAMGLASAYGDLDDPVEEESEFPVPTGNEILRIWDCFRALGKTAGTTTLDRAGASVSRWVWVGEQ